MKKKKKESANEAMAKKRIKSCIKRVEETFVLIYVQISSCVDFVNIQQSQAITMRITFLLCAPV